MSKFRVVVVDDSAFMRKLISDIIEEDEQLQVVAKLRNGKELIDNIDKLNPDIVTLDLEMPVMDGLETLKALRRLNKKYNVIMLSSLTESGSRYTLECLDWGAIDFIHKPSGSISMDIAKIGEELLEKIHGILQDKTRRRSKIESPQPSREVNRVRHTGGINAVVIGASTGGPKALQRVLPKIDKDINVPIFVVQHMPKGFTKAFADRLDAMCSLKVVEAKDGMEVKKNTIYIAEGGHHMLVNKNRIVMSDAPTMWGVRPAVDKLFEAAAKTYCDKLLSVILTGMGRDGASGTALIKDFGGVTIAESETTSIIYGMPKAAFETGKVDMVLPVDEIGLKINQLVKGR